jgi:nucleotide-binding universal stress UspA family protein
MPPHDDTLRVRAVVFPTDGSVWAEQAFAQAAFYAANHGASLHVLTVTPRRSRSAPGSGGSSAVRAGLRDATVDTAGLDLVQASVEAASPDEGILAYAERVDADLIVMGTQGRRGLDHLVLGSVAEAVVRRAHCPVLTVGPTAERPEGSARRILVPTDFSDASYFALAHGLALARLHGAELALLHVVEAYAETSLGTEVYGWGDNAPRRVDEAQAALVDLVDDLGAFDVPIERYAVMGLPAPGVLGATEHLAPDLVVMGTHGRTGVRRLLMGSVAEKIVQFAPCPVFVVKPFGKSLLPATSFEREAVLL